MKRSDAREVAEEANDAVGCVSHEVAAIVVMHDRPAGAVVEIYPKKMIEAHDRDRAVGMIIKHAREISPPSCL